MSKIASSLLLLAVTLSVSAQQAHFARVEIPVSEGCRYVEFVYPPNTVQSRLNVKASWDGSCVDGYISGQGTLFILGPNDVRQEIRATFVVGVQNGQGESISRTPSGTLTFKGVWVDGKRESGREEFAGTDGRTGFYEGQYFNEKRHGKGILRGSGGDTWEGIFSEGSINGFGKLTYANRAIYEGFMKSGVPEGPGTTTLPSGEVRFGRYIGGHLRGIGQIKFANGNNYSGEIHYDRPFGKGKIVYANGAEYEGDFVGGNPDGKGSLKFANGSVYEGIFKDGRITGEGLLKGLDGTRYAGTFIDGLLNGHSTVTFPNGAILVAPHIGGQPDGYGKITYTNGFVGEGTFRSGKMEGRWNVSSASGDVYEVEYREGVKISERLVRSTALAPSTDADRAAVRQRGIDSLTCEAYARQATADQQVVSPPVTSGTVGLAAISVITQGFMIQRNRQAWYDSCMKKLGN